MTYEAGEICWKCVHEPEGERQPLKERRLSLKETKEISQYATGTTTDFSNPEERTIDLVGD